MRKLSTTRVRGSLYVAFILAYLAIFGFAVCSSAYPTPANDPTPTATTYMEATVGPTVVGDPTTTPILLPTYDFGSPRPTWTTVPRATATDSPTPTREPTSPPPVEPVQLPRAGG